MGWGYAAKVQRHFPLSCPTFISQPTDPCHSLLGDIQTDTLQLYNNSADYLPGIHVQDDSLLTIISSFTCRTEQNQ